MLKNKYTVPMLITLFLYFSYFIISFFHSDLYGNILSPVLDFFILLILLKSFFVTNEKARKDRRIIWLCYSLACINWLIADCIWALLYFKAESNLDSNPIITFFYTVSSIFICIAVFTAGYLFYKKWNILQLLLDSLTITISIIFLLWILFFNRNIYFLDVLADDGILSIISISCSIMILTFIMLWYVSIRKGKISPKIIIVGLGSILYSLTDLYYYYEHFNHIFKANSFLDSAYLGSFVLIAAGSFLNLNCHTAEIEETYHFGYSIKRFLLFLCPLTVLLTKGFVINDILVFLVIILLYHTLGAYSQNYENNEQLLIAEKKNNLALEEKIEKRTKEILEKNNALKAKNKELEYLSKHDSVTNLYNRRYFLQTLENDLNTAASSDIISLLFIDLDHFKMINDNYGHHIGDKVLVEIARRLKTLQLEYNCFIARLSGDEFVIIFYGNNNHKSLEIIAQTIINICSKVIEIEQYIIHISVSIGISIYPTDAADRSTLMRNADIAMYQAKAQGRKRFMSFDSTFKDKLNRKSEIEFQLKNSNFNEFELYYQPQYSIKTKKMIGAEALLRWNNKVLGWISPSEFIPITEELDLLTTIGNWVTVNAVKQIGIWNSAYKTNLIMGINVSPKQLDHKDFITNLKSILNHFAVSPEFIDIELTESITIEGEERMKQVESLFRGLGVSISIDDFGTGYSSLSYLKFFPFDRIKIAKPLIDTLSKDDFDLQIVKAVILLAKSIGIKTIAEGVELQEQYDILEELGCDEIQGFLLGKPLPADKFEELIEATLEDTYTELI